MRRYIPSGKILVVEGPASLRVIHGEIESMGKIFRIRDKLVVPKGRVTTVKILKDSVVDINLGEGGSIREEVKEKTIPPQWHYAVSEVLRSPVRPIKTLILGEVDSGKSALTLLLTNEAVRRGLKTLVIDIDVGQTDVGVPTTISLGYVNRPISSLAGVKILDGYFVGSTSAEGLIHRVLIGVQKLNEKALSLNPDVIIYNTSGWIKGWEARELKYSIILSIKPTHILALEDINEVEHLIRSIEKLSFLRVIRLPAILKLKTRDYRERKMLREITYRRYLANAKLRTFTLDEVSLMYCVYGGGRILGKNEIRDLEENFNIKIHYAEETEDYLLIVLEKPLKHERRRELIEKLRNLYEKRILLIYKGYEENVLVGLFDDKLNFLGIGIIKGIDYKEGKLRILTNVDKKVSLIQVGKIKVNERGEEVTKLRNYPF